MKSVRYVRSVRFFLFLLASLCLCGNAFSALSLENGPATNITATNAWLVGNLTGTNATNATLTVYYGTGAGGTNPAWWQYSNYCGTAAGTGSISILTTNLNPATWHYYRWQATEGTNTAWSGATSNFTTLARPGTNFPPATGGIYLVVGTNGVVLAPTNFFVANLGAMIAAGVITNESSFISWLSTNTYIQSNTGNWGGTWLGLGTNAFDSAGAAAGVDSNVTAHVNNTNNPHAVTPAQIGAVATNTLVAGGIVYTITNTPGTNDVLKFDPATQSAYFSVESGGLSELKTIEHYDGDSLTVTGKVYMWSSNGWLLASCATSTQCNGYIGLALGTNSTVEGIQTYGKLTVTNNDLIKGKAFFVGLAGEWTQAPLTNSGYALRYLGCATKTNEVLINPDGIWVVFP